MESIPLHRPRRGRNAVTYMEQALSGGVASAGPFTAECERWLERRTGSARALLLPSCTSALDCCALLLDLRPGDEVVVPSWTYASTGGAFAAHGAVPVFVDIRPDTLNIDENRIREAITARTRAIVVTHYAGVACEMDAIMKLAEESGLMVIEDAAQGLLADYRGRALGAIGHLGALSFHDTKNVGCGEGGAILINDPTLVERGEILRDKGTNRQLWQQGHATAYEWLEPSSCGPPPEIIAALLLAQLEEAERFTASRLESWRAYMSAFEAAGTGIILPRVPAHCGHNGHIFHLRTGSTTRTADMLRSLNDAGIQAGAHYRPLHLSGGVRYGRVVGPMTETTNIAEGLIRLPLWAEMPAAGRQRVIDTVLAAESSRSAAGTTFGNQEG